MDLTGFLLARIAEDEETAKAAGERAAGWRADDRGGIGGGGTWDEQAWDPDSPGCWYGEETIVYDEGYPHPEEAQHIARWDPARVLAECAAKRRIVTLHTGAHECSTFDRRGDVDNCTWVPDYDDCSTMQLLAVPHAEHPDYDETWLLPA